MDTDRKSTNNLTYYYVLVMARKKGYNLQSMAIRKFLTNIKEKQFTENLSLNITDFNRIYEPFIARDLVFKNNSFVTRKTLLISPAHYFYYTKLVFDLILSNVDESNENQHSYSMSNIKSFYSGMLYRNINPNDSLQASKVLFDYSYNNFQEELLKYEGNQGFVIDLSDFFESISTNNLFEILYSKFNGKHVLKLEEFFDLFEVKDLPQFHYSIASSLLSQEYLSTFDYELNKILIEENFKMVRFVDDMYFFNIGKDLEEGHFHLMVDRVNKLLWKTHLNINSNKVEFFIDNLFERSLVETNYKEEIKFRPEQKIKEKSQRLINQDFMSFIRDVNKLYINKGYDINSFTTLFNNTFSINNEDARKVLNNFVFSNSWTKLSDNDLKYIMYNYHFIFYLPDIFFALYLKVYTYIESKYERNEETIREILSEMDKKSNQSLRYVYASIYYLVQRGFKRNYSKENIREFDKKLGNYIVKYVQ